MPFFNTPVKILFERVLNHHTFLYIISRFQLTWPGVKQYLYPIWVEFVSASNLVFFIETRQLSQMKWNMCMGNGYWNHYYVILFY